MMNYGLLANQGRREDNALMGGQVAHISAAEAEMLRRMGGAGTTNPATGLPEYWAFGFGPGTVGQSAGLGFGAPGGGGAMGGPAPQAPTTFSPPPAPPPSPAPLAPVPSPPSPVGFQTEGGGGLGFLVGGGAGEASTTALGGSVAPGDTSYTQLGNWEGAPTFGEAYAAETFAPNSPMNTANPFAAYSMGYSPFTAAPPSLTFSEALGILGPIAFSALTGGVPGAVMSLFGTVAQAMAKGGTFGKTAASVANAVAGITGAPQGGPSGPVSYAKTGASKGGLGSAVTGSISASPPLPEPYVAPPAPFPAASTEPFTGTWWDNFYNFYGEDAALV